MNQPKIWLNSLNTLPQLLLLFLFYWVYGLLSAWLTMLFIGIDKSVGEILIDAVFMAVFLMLAFEWKKIKMLFATKNLG